MNKEWLAKFKLKLSQEAQDMAGSGEYDSFTAIVDELSRRVAKDEAAYVSDLLKPERSTIMAQISLAKKNFPNG